VVVGVAWESYAARLAGRVHPDVALPFTAQRLVVAGMVAARAVGDLAFEDVVSLIWARVSPVKRSAFYAMRPNPPVFPSYMLASDRWVRGNREHG
jgi:hypothetical protein